MVQGRDDPTDSTSRKTPRTDYLPRNRHSEDNALDAVSYWGVRPRGSLAPITRQGLTFTSAVSEELTEVTVPVDLSDRVALASAQVREARQMGGYLCGSRAPIAQDAG